MSRVSGYMLKGAMIGMAVGMGIGVSATCIMNNNRKCQRYIKQMPKSIKNCKAMHTVEDLISSIAYAMK